MQLSPAAFLASAPLVLLAPAIPSTGAPRLDPGPGLGGADTTLEATGPKEQPMPGAVGIGDPYFPGLGNGGYDVQHYHLVLDVDMEERVLTATATITARSLHALSAFNLDLHGLEVGSVAVDGEKATFSRDGRELTVTPARAIENHVEFEVQVTYGGVPELAPDASMPGRPGSGWSHTDSGVYVVSECVGSASWFPCNDHPRDKATFSFDVTAPKPYVVAANGILELEEDLGEERRFVFRSKFPMATYLATVNIAEFEVRVEEGPHGLPLRTYYPKDLTPQELAPFDKQTEIVEFLELCFGPYPFESVGAVISYESIGGALETQTIPVYGRSALTEGVIAHELAHQWFGDCVSTENWRDMWLNEGFATYAAHLWLEYSKGPDAAQEAMTNRYHMLRSREVGPPPDPGVQRVFGARTYQRGAWVLHNLRSEVEDEAFFEIMQLWTIDEPNRNSSTEDFVAHCEEVSGRDLEEFFAGVLYAPVIPEDPRYEGAID